jgi:hypothetical protein
VAKGDQAGGDVVSRHHDEEPQRSAFPTPWPPTPRLSGQSLNETVKQSLIEAVERRRNNPKFKARLAKIIKEDRELLERLAK